MLKMLHNAFLSAPTWFQVVFVAVWIYAILWAIDWVLGFIKYYRETVHKIAKERADRLFAVRDEIDGYIVKSGVQCYQRANGSRYFIIEGHVITEEYLFSQMAANADFDQMINFFEKLHKENPSTPIKVKKVSEEETK